MATRASQHLAQPVDTDTVREAVEGLASLNLLDGNAERDLGVSRREVVRKAALVGAGAAVAGPVIKSIVAPTPAMAQSPGECSNNGGRCSADADCCSGCCANQEDPETGFCISRGDPNFCGGPSVNPEF